MSISSSNHAPTQQMSQRKPDIGYIPTPYEIVESILTFAKVSADDILYDLGSGDGRMVIMAAQQFGTRGVGIDIDHERIIEANENAKKVGVIHCVEFRQQDLFCCEFGEATVVFLYLLPHLNLRLRSELFRQLKPGVRVVSRDFDMGEWQPEQTVQIKTVEEATLYHWVIPQDLPQHLHTV